MLDREAIENRFAEIRRRRAFLENFIDVDYEDFVPVGPEDPARDYCAALHYIQVALQACIDVAKHIIAVKNFETPKEIRDAFSILARRKVISKDLARKFERATGVRNILAHSYTNIDPRRIHQIIQEDLPGFERFVNEIGEYLKKERK